MMKRLFLGLCLLALGMMVGAVVAQDTPSGKLVVVRFQITTGDDDVNQDGEGFENNLQTVWFGSGESLDDSYLGLRFTNVSIPAGATILAAHVNVYTPQDMWSGLAMSLDVEATDDSLPFSLDAMPSSRTMTGESVSHLSDEPWLGENWFALNNVAPALQAVVDRPGWLAGNSVSVIMHGEQFTYARKFITAYEANPHHAAQLLVVYKTP